MSWHLGNLACFDTESTGVDVENDRIVSVTVAHIVPGEQPEVASHLIAVDVDIPQAAIDVHGITTEHARANGKSAGEVLEAVAAHLVELMANGIPVIGMNCAFDFTLLDRGLRRHGLPTLEDRLGREPGPIVDIFVVDKALDRYRKGGRQLADMCAHYGVRLDGAHDATADALGAARVAYRMGHRGEQALTEPDVVADLYGDRRYPMELVRAWQAFGRMSLDALHAAQVGWYREQSESFAQYLRRQANELKHQARRAKDDVERETGLADAEMLRRRADEVTTDWPMRPYGGAR